ncbi:flagellar hook-basal body complex protein FliE [Scandinavium goeteborgense]|uniref:Flagellar hook-basal body complex protein FliE n=1 Tax=Scandinavium goeteborgense TaxID=1851514 RepID=A0A4R6E6Q9_SCAGO|nr:flagellar hook-basal body complex protein FliE [Scandinavium goeteborgense]QKN82905.1 flagellar hook-basal body complex protein FliE [Scandinavium goeteborgense]TDN53600.1 flagellar hook-basal body complex protein FliE [Scandinavium goeteborgense]
MNTLTITPASTMQTQMLQDMTQMRAVADAPVLPAAHANIGESTSSAATPSFSHIMSASLHRVDGYEHTAQVRQNAIDMGKSDDLAGAMIASQQASLSFSALVQVRNKVASGINDLMSMSI